MIGWPPRNECGLNIFTPNKQCSPPFRARLVELALRQLCVASPAKTVREGDQAPPYARYYVATKTYLCEYPHGAVSWQCGLRFRR